MIDKFVTIIIPCRNEEKFIGKCMDSIFSNDYPNDRLEVLVVDGESTDQTRAIVDRYRQKYPFIKLISNPQRVIPAAMNLGIKNARGEIIIKMDAHSIYPQDYISKNVYHLLHSDAQNVGGSLTIVPSNESEAAQAIALILSHPFASGNAYVKVGSIVPRLADTVAYGCYRKEIFDKVGYFNEALVGSSDMDFNTRLKQAGGKILMVPDIKVGYFSDPDLLAFWRHNFADGLWVTYVLKYGSKGFSSRHLIPFLFVSALLFCGLLAMVSSAGWWGLGVLGGLYLGANLASSLHLAVQKKQIKLLAYFPLIFAIRHVVHGLGAWWGLILIAVPGLTWKGRRSA